MSRTRTNPTLHRRRFLATLAAAASLIAISACAASAPARQGLATLEVFDRDSGQVLPNHFKDGRRFVAGRPGARYALRLRNLSATRVLVVLSVDGVNVISGQTAGSDQVGYVLDPGRWADINGWRKSGTEVAAFEFAPIERAYATLTGRPDNVGVIGMAVFRERVVDLPQVSAPTQQAPARLAREESRADADIRASAGAAAPSPAAEKSAAADAAGSRLGTGHGQREWSVSQRTRFERAGSSPDQSTQIEYDSHDRLVAAGVIVDHQAYARPRPFPSNEAGFVADPPRR